MSENKPLISRFRKVGDLIFLSGMTGGSGDPETQIKNTLERIRATLESAGSSMENIVKATVYLTDLSYRALYLNDIWRSYFPENPPTRTCVEAGLAQGTYVEITTVATAKK
jgi:2-iminobutanoate/2-iminopropanoate deaminase